MDNGSNLINLATIKCPPNNSFLPFFTEIILCNNLEIPPQKPDIEHITNITLNPIVTDIEVIDVDLGDGVTYKKLVIRGTLEKGLEYSADEPEQQVHFAHFEIPFQGLIGMRPCNPTNRGLLPADFDIENFTINVCIEHEQNHVVDSRHFKEVVVLLIWLEPII